MKINLISRLKEANLSALANKLKNKSEVDITDLQMIKNLLIQDENNIKLVLKTHGALRGLVREISGKQFLVVLVNSI